MTKRRQWTSHGVLLLTTVCFLVMLLDSTKAQRVRLEKGNTLDDSTDGMVHFNYKKDRFSPVCASGFDQSAANVVCRDLGYNSASIVCCNVYGTNYHKIFVTDVTCTGNESTFSNCSYNIDGDCDMDNYAAVACYNKQEENKYQISLLGESYTGAVTVKYYGLEGHICSDEWDDADAQVACRELGFANGEMFNRLRTEEQQKPFWSSKFKCTGRERRLGDCNHSGWGQIKQCKSQHYAGVLCYDEQGLSFEVGDGSSAAGLLNISINGKWGVVCDPKWNDANARVLCRSMGYTDGRTWDDVGKQNASALWGTVLECKGDEASLKNCGNMFWKTSEVCLPKPRLASAQCTHDGSLHTRVQNGKSGTNYISGRLEVSRNGLIWETVCADKIGRNEINAACASLGFRYGTGVINHRFGAGTGNVYRGQFVCDQDAKTLQTCLQTTRTADCDRFSSIGVFCYNDPKDVFKMRLVGGQEVKKMKAGRLEVAVGDLPWGSVCADSFGEMEAEAACRQMGYQHGDVYTGPLKGQPSNIVLAKVRCISPEGFFQNCNQSLFGDGDCRQSRPVAVRCINAAVRLKTSSDDTFNAGTVQLYTEGEGWYDVCHDGWNKIDAQKVCSELGFTDGREMCCNTEILPLGYRYQVTSFQPKLEEREVLLAIFNTDGEARLLCVPAKEWGKNIYKQCQHNTNPVSATANSRLGSKNSECPALLPTAVWRQLGKLSRDVNDETITKFKGLFSKGHSPSSALEIHKMDRHMEHGVNYIYQAADRAFCPDLQFCHRLYRKIFEEKYSPTSSKQLIDSLETACRTFNAEQNGEFCKLGYSPAGSDTAVGVYTNVSCSFNDQSLSVCNKRKGAPFSCPKMSNGVRGLASAICYEEPRRMNTSVQVHISGDELAGPVSVSRFGLQGQICMNKFTDNEAQVVCRMLGHRGGRALGPVPSAESLVCEGPVWLQSLKCRGTESTIENCDVSTWGLPMEKCTVGNPQVVCYRSELNISLSSGRNLGSVEITRDHERGGICSLDTTDVEASVICKSMGYRGGKVMTGKKLYSTPTTFFLSEVQCNSTDTAIFSCKGTGWQNPSERCQIDGKQLEVFCYGDVRLNPGGDFDGVVETYDAATDSWNPVCGEGFDNNTAQVVCRQMGYSLSYLQPRWSYASHTTPRSLTGLQCTGRENHINDCPRTSLGACRADDYVSVTCLHNKPQISDKYILDFGTNSRLHATGRVQVYQSGVFGYVCDDQWTAKDASVICRGMGNKGGIPYYSPGSFPGPYFVNQPGCYGNETTLEECLGSKETNSCSSRRAAGVLCYSKSAPVLRIGVDSHAHNMGVLRLAVDYKDGRICALGWDDKDAHVACTQMGFRDGLAVNFHRMDGPVYLSNLTCTGSENNLFQCGNEGWRTNRKECEDAFLDAGVICFHDVRLVDGNAKANQLTGTVHVWHGDKVKSWKSLCGRTFSDNEATSICNGLGFRYYAIMKAAPLVNDYEVIGLQCSGKEASAASCQYTSVQCNDQDGLARLTCFNDMDDNHQDLGFTWSIQKGYYGEVYIAHSHIKGVVCEEGWGDKEAATLCRQFGFAGGRSLGTTMLLNEQELLVISNVSCPQGASDMSQCTYITDVSPQCRNTLTAAGVLCDKTDNGIEFRLSGSSIYEGVVEVSYDGVWGRVCNTSWSKDDADVLCRQLGFKGGDVSNGGYSVTSGPIYLDNVQCGPHHRSLLACPNDGWGSYKCVGGYARVKCDPKVTLSSMNFGVVQVWKGDAYSLKCSHGFDDEAAHNLCSSLGNFFGKSLCCDAFGKIPFSLTAEEVQCAGHIGEAFDKCKIRASEYSQCLNDFGYASAVCSTVQSGDAYSIKLSLGQKGQIMITHFNHEGFICSEGFDNDAASVVCQEAGYKAGFAYIYNNPRNTPIQDIRWLGNLNCSGSERRLKDCSNARWGQLGNCHTSRDAAAMCFKSAEMAKVAWRLVEGPTRKEGRVEVLINGTWGTVCGLSVTDREAAVICQQMGYPSGTVNNIGKHGAGIGPVWLSNISCTGAENSPFKCPMNHLGKADSECASHNYDLSIKCDDAVRLVGTSKDYGRVEVLSPATKLWLPVCQDNFSPFTANLICRELGYDQGHHQCCSAFGPVSSTNFSLVECTGQESDLSHCRLKTEASCFSGEYISLACSSAGRDDGLKAQLQGFAGMAMAYRYLMAGAICADGFTTKEATVFCMELGYEAAYVLPPLAVTSSMPIVLGALRCTGEERLLKNCNYPPFEVSIKNCTSRTAANVLCSKTKAPIKYRLNPGDFNRGRAEIFVDGNWGLISFSANNLLNVHIFCREMRFTSGRVIRGRSSNLRQASIVVTPACSGQEKSFLECPADWNPKQPSSALFMECTRGVGLKRGLTPADGALYAKPLDGDWGAVCGKGFTQASADVACSEMGYEHGIATCCQAYGQNSDSISMSKVSCSGTESRLLDCPLSTTHDERMSCDLQDYASVACYNGQTPKDYKLKLSGERGGEVKVTYLGIEGRICSDSWDNSDALVTCRELGFSKGEAYTHLKDPYLDGDKTGPYWSSEFNCTGNEIRLGDCSHIGWGNVTSCPSKHFAGALCYDDQGFSFKLGQGDIYYGLVNISVNGVWGTLCDPNWNHASAAVLCRMIGYSDGELWYAKNQPTNQLSEPLWGSKLQCQGNEKKLDDCSSVGWVPASQVCSSFSYLATAYCYGRVKLSSGRPDVVSHGAVIIYHKNQWLQVCDAGFDDVTARKACQNMGYNDGKAICCSAYKGVSVFEMHPNVTVRCNGNEATINDCIREEACTSGQYASVICLKNDQSFKENYDIKLSQQSTGALSVTYYGVPGRICSQEWDDADASVYCRSAGFTSGFAFHQQFYNSPTEQDVGPFWLSDFRCTGKEGNLMDCPHQERLSLGNCSASHTASVVCYRESGIQYRINGGNHNTGRVELAIDGQWGSVCGVTWDDQAASVFCRSLNFTHGVAITNTDFGQGSGPIWMNGVICNGTEASIHQCPHAGFYKGKHQGLSLCNSHDYDAAVFCHQNVRLNRPHGSSEGGLLVYQGNKWTGVCDSQFSNVEATVACRSLMQGFNDGVVIPGSSFGDLGTDISMSIKCQGDEKDISKCHISMGSCPSQQYMSVSCSTTPIDVSGMPVRFAENDNSAYHGIVEVRYKGVWSRICQQGWDDADATVFCRQLGYKAGVQYLHHKKNPQPIQLRDMDCFGNEKLLSNCNYSTSPDLKNCNFGSNDAGAICYNNTGIAYRLYGGFNSGDNITGRVEIAYDGEWGTICEWDWSASNARVLCRNLGYLDGIPASAPSPPLPEREYFLSASFCDGNENNIFSCLNTGFKSGYLGDLCGGEAYATCYKQEVAITSIRLVNTEGKVGTNHGRVEVFVQGPNAWGCICDDYWDHHDASVVCRELGYDYGVAHSQGKHEIANGYIWLDNVECLGNETSLTECKHRGISTTNCQHYEDAGVSCYSFTWSIQKGYYGEVHVAHSHIKGVVCEEGWGDKEAATLCRQFGFAGGRFLGTTMLRTEQGVTFFNVSCPQGASDMSQCSTVVSPQCHSMTAAGVLCYRTNNGIEFRLAGGSLFEGQVMVGYDGEWHALHTTSWSKDDADVLCRELGFTGGDISNATYNVSSSPIFLGNVQCGPHHRSLLACPNDGWGSYKYIGDYARVHCVPKVTLSNITFGAVQVWKGDAYSLKCSHGFDDEAASTLCLSLGYSHGRSACCNFFGTFPLTTIESKCGHREEFDTCKNILATPQCFHDFGYASAVCSTVNSSVDYMSTSTTKPTTTFTTSSTSRITITSTNASSTTTTTPTTTTSKPTTKTTMSTTTTTKQAQTTTTTQVYTTSTKPTTRQPTTSTKPTITVKSSTTPPTTKAKAVTSSVSVTPTKKTISDYTSTHSSNTPVEGGITEAQAQSTVKTNAAAIAVPIIVILLVASVSVVVMYKFRQRRKAIPHQRFDDNIMEQHPDGSIAMQNQLYDMGGVEVNPFTLSGTSKYMTGASEITLGSDGNAHYTNQSNGQTQRNGDDGYANPLFNVVGQAASSKRMDKNGVY